MKNSIDAVFKYAAKNDSQSLKKAIDEGIDPNSLHLRAGTLLLQIACQFNALDCIEVLLVAGADPSKRFTWVSRVDGRTFKDHVPLMYAESVQAARLLVGAGADLEPRDEKGWTPLVYSANAGDIERFKYLLSCGSDPSVLISYGQRLLSIREMLEMRVEDLVVAVEHDGRNDLVPMIERLRAIRDILVEIEFRSS